MIEQKLQECRVELQKLKLKKSGKNKFAGFSYFELADFLPTVNEMFAKRKIFSNFSINGHATLTVKDTEDNTEVIFTSPTAELELKGCNAVQALGGVHTYLKRYLYLNALEIVESDLFDATSGQTQPEKPKTQKQVVKEVFEGKEIDKITQDDKSLVAGCMKCQTVEELNEYYKEIVTLLSCKSAKELLIKRCAERKEQLQ